MINKFRYIQFALLLTLIAAATAFADVKIKTRTTAAGGEATENAVYFKGKRQRTEIGETAEIVSITQCDLRRTVQLLPATQTYLVNEFDQTSEAANGTVKTNGKTETTVVRGGTVTTTYTVRDTGERRQMFGYTARHIITTIETKASPDACSKDDTKMEMDSWVIDAEFALACGAATRNGYTAASSGGCQDRQIVKNVGAAKQGYPLYSKMTMFDTGGKPSFSSITEVVELSKINLDAALFEVPANYRETENTTDLYAANNSPDVTNGNSVLMPQSSNKNYSTADSSSNSVNTSNNVKKAGVVRLGLALVKTGTVGEGVNAQELSAAVKNTLAEYLKMPNVEVVTLETKLPSAIDQEAMDKQCDFVIYANISHKKGGGGMFGKALGKLSETLAKQAYGSSNVIGKVTQVTVMTAAAATQNVKAKDQMTLELIIVELNTAAPEIRKQFQAKAKADGEDIITPLVEQAAQMIINQTTKK